MGWDIIAYFDIDQKIIDDFILSNNINKNDSKQTKAIEIYFKENYLKKGQLLWPKYLWNEESKMHEMYDRYCITFIRSDDRFENHEDLEKKIGRPFPNCLKRITWDIHSSNDALEIAKELWNFFPDDMTIFMFAKWLYQTSQYCSTYNFTS